MISFIVPIYNAETYLPACLESLSAQTEKDLQIFLVDDESTDDSLAIAKRYEMQDQRVEIYTQSHAGQSAARNEGLRHVKGEFIAFLDADDTIEPDWCERHLKAIEGVDYVQSGYERNAEKQTPRNPYQYTSPCMRLYRRKAIEALHFQEGMIYEDVLWSADLWIHGASCRKIEYTGYHYTVNPHSTTSSPHPEAQKRVLNELKKRLTTAPWSKKHIVLYTLIRLKCHFWKS